jgi:hypothetical protein
MFPRATPHDTYAMHVRDQPAGIARSCSAAVGGAPAWCASGGAAGISGPSRYLCEW